MLKKRITPKRILLAVCSVLATTILALSVNIFSGWGWTKLGEEYLPHIAVAATICILVLIFFYVYEYSEPAEVVVQKYPDQRKQLIQNLKELYRDRFTEKMKGDLRLDISLKLKYTTTGTNPERIEKFFLIKKEKKVFDFDQLFSDYVDKIKRLLILGEPGAGKSILMLNFGLKLIEKAEKDENFPVPIILDLATWKNDNQTFEHWLEENLPYIGGSFAISKEESRRLVETNTLLLLLDGFDEIKEQYRNSCLMKLQTYLSKIRNSRKKTLPEVILCSRISEYLSSDDAPVFATIEIQPLQPKDVQDALKPMVAHNDEPAIELQRALNDSPYLYTAITSAFFLHILLNIYTRENKHAFITDASKELLQKDIIKIYIQTLLSR